ncbi:MAG: CehA/McbA family metallohydrolase [Verrucomicrobia bacterium]|nr:CehA/McbA family metallohydrolase [Verrucomicrobiota bacterium]
MRNRWQICLVGLVVLAMHSEVRASEVRLLTNGRIHLRSGDVPEWAEFAGRTPDGRRLDLRFSAQANATEATLFIRQEDVRQDWPIELNGKPLGKLFLMEADLVHTLAIAAGTLKDGENVLSILPSRDNDDIVLHDIGIDVRPMRNALCDGMLTVHVTDRADGKGLPCRLTIVNTQGALAPLAGLSPAKMLAVRPGVVYTGNGRAELGLPAGKYTVFASRGFEWSVATQRVQIAVGVTARLDFQLNRAVPTPGWVSCDTHVHTLTHSGHGDATVEERMLTLAGEGIELPIATEHNANLDYTVAARRAGLTEWFTPVAGNEVTSPAGHFNIFPVDPFAPAPEFNLTDWPRLMKGLRATPNVRVVVLNHPRNIHNKFQPFAATNFNSVSGDHLRGPEFTFDAMEVLNSSAQQSDFMLVYRDWFALLNHGYRVTAVGSSDGHDVSRYIVGQGRTYIACPDRQAGHIDVAAACSSLLAGRALVSMGLFADLSVNKRYRVGDLATKLDKELRVTVRVLAPPWAMVTNVCLFANGLKVREQTLANVHDKNVTWKIPRPAHDMYLVAMALGPGVRAPYWAIPRPYQPTSPYWVSRVIASTNPIWLDADDDGKFTAARAYAQRLVHEHGAGSAKLISALGQFDEAVAVQAASLCTEAGVSFESTEFADALKSGPVHVRRGFNAFATTLR